ncbi:MAG TPA: DUF488 domain-containing protein [Chloroflexota bacterium]|jgi:uncharacterized protein (DUF488 family)|nr:DUF488 domain-containing protein [Chloroflexota bacterium]
MSGPGAAEVLTIGHSNHPLARFIALLQAHGVQRVVDVRSEPYSRHAPHFAGRALQARLPAHGIGYQFLGHLLGGRPRDPRLYLPARPRDGRRTSPVRLPLGYVDYEALARTAAFQEGIARVLADAPRERLALLCSEEDPARCHRHLLIAPALVARGVRVAHIRADGRLQPAAELFAGEVPAPARQGSLFDVLEEAAQ